MDERQRTCFVIMPFGGWFDAYYRDVYRPAVEDAGLVARRADDLYSPKAIVTDVWQYTQEASVILADLTTCNPNVFYELGIAHALAKPAVLTAESIDDIPFDLRSLRVLVYDKNLPDWGGKLKSEIVRAIQDIQRSPESSILHAFLDRPPSPERPVLTPLEMDILSIRQDLDLLKRERTYGTHIIERAQMSERDAEAYVQEELESGIPPSVVVRRLVAFGIPEDWAQKRVEEHVWLRGAS